MPTQIEEDAVVLLDALASEPRDVGVGGPRLSEKTGLPPERVNDAMSMLVDAGLAEWEQTFGTAPYDFSEALITSRGRYEHQRVVEASEAVTVRDSVAAELVGGAISPPIPVGSSFGFKDEDWEKVSERKARRNQLRVVRGHQFVSTYYDTEKPRENVKASFEAALVEYHERQMGPRVSLKFRVLRAGYGEHLFNEIARDIISADIAVFEASDLNPNVMIEMGVALTWGIRVWPIKAVGRPSPPSDLSGQTWAEYEDSGARFPDPHHQSNLARMIERAIQRRAREPDRRQPSGSPVAEVSAVVLRQHLIPHRRRSRRLPEFVALRRLESADAAPPLREGRDRPQGTGINSSPSHSWPPSTSRRPSARHPAIGRPPSAADHR